MPAVLSAVVASGGLAFAVLAGLDSSPAWRVARVVVVIAAIALAVWFTRRAGRPGRGNGFAARRPAGPGGPPPSTPPTRPRCGHDPATARHPASVPACPSCGKCHPGSLLPLLCRATVPARIDHDAILADWPVFAPVGRCTQINLYA